MSKRKNNPYPDKCNFHHIIPSSRGGTWDKSNIFLFCKKKHDTLHKLFGNLRPHEQIGKLCNIQKSNLSESFYSKIREIVHTTPIHKIYKDECYTLNTNKTNEINKVVHMHKGMPYKENQRKQIKCTYLLDVLYNTSNPLEQIMSTIDLSNTALVDGFPQKLINCIIINQNVAVINNTDNYKNYQLAI